eukprot:1050863-Rhodomonas_salina.1
MSQSEREEVCATVKSYDGDVEMATLELWKVFLDKPESSWKMVDSLELREEEEKGRGESSQPAPPAAEKKGGDEPKKKAEEDKKEPENNDEVDEDDDWETSVDNFKAKASNNKSGVDEWEVRLPFL